jgi:hypothetical protein
LPQLTFIPPSESDFSEEGCGKQTIQGGEKEHKVSCGPDIMLSTRTVSSMSDVDTKFWSRIPERRPLQTPSTVELEQMVSDTTMSRPLYKAGFAIPTRQRHMWSQQSKEECIEIKMYKN